uniref:Uncharacterized protein n=1 Tax=Tanacetum cinerariifolium TaxID=118510 RepID=A0A699GT67_TANCI|nr:hypothetical protein [Tanacetum cinerariifolium]
MFIKYSTGLIPLKKTRGKGSHGKKAIVSPKPASNEESDETDAKPPRKRTSRRRKLKGVHTLTPEEQLAADTMQAFKAIIKSIRSQPHARGSSKGIEIPTVSSATTPLPPHQVSTILLVLQQSTTPIPTPPITTKAPPITTVTFVVTTIPDPLPTICQRVYVLKKYVQELKYPQQDNFKDVIKDSMQANIINETPTTLAQSSAHAQSSLKAVESLSEYELKMLLFENMDKSRSYLTHDQHQALFDALLNSMSLDDAFVSGQADPKKILRKIDREDEDTLAGPNQEPACEMASDDVEQTVDDVVNDDD